MLYTGALAACLLASCSQDGDGIPGGASHAPLTVGAVSMAGGTKATPGTRAAVLPTPVVTGTLWAGIRGGNGYTARTGLIYTYGGGKWTCPAEVALGKDPVSLYAYWPQNIYPEMGGTVTLATQPYDAGKDLGHALSGGGNVCSAHPAAGFVLNHAYARVRIDIALSRFFEDSATLDFVSVVGGGLCSTGTLVLENGAVVPGTALPGLEWVSGQTVASIGRKYTGDMLVVPSASLTDSRLVVRISGVRHVAELGSALAKLESGKSYLITAEVKTDPAFVIGKVEVEDWIAGTPQSGDTQFE